MIEFEQLKRIVEAALLASSTPLSLPQLFTLFALPGVGMERQPGQRVMSVASGP